jgi:ribonuclease Y
MFNDGSNPMLFTILYISIFIIGLVLGGAIIFFFRRIAVNRLLRVTQRKANRTLIEAKDEAKKIVDQSRIESEKVRSTADNEYRERRLELQRQENRLLSKTENLERKLEGVTQRERALTNKEKSLENLQAQIEEAKNKELKQLEIISGMSTEQAKEILLKSVESEMKEEASRRLH